mgnify:CR=1 FL=1
MIIKVAEDGEKVRINSETRAQIKDYLYKTNTSTLKLALEMTRLAELDGKPYSFSEPTVNVWVKKEGNKTSKENIVYLFRAIGREDLTDKLQIVGSEEKATLRFVGGERVSLSEVDRKNIEDYLDKNHINRTKLSNLMNETAKREGKDYCFSSGSLSKWIRFGTATYKQNLDYVFKAIDIHSKTIHGCNFTERVTLPTHFKERSIDHKIDNNFEEEKKRLLLEEATVLRPLYEKLIGAYAKAGPLRKKLVVGIEKLVEDFFVEE